MTDAPPPASTLDARPSGLAETVTAPPSQAASGQQRYLSLQWISDLDATARGDEGLRQLATARRFAVTETITGGLEGDVTYHVQLADGGVRVGPGPADHEDVRFIQDWDTAVGVATGRINAQEAFLRGSIRFSGDHEALLANQDLFVVLDSVFAAVRTRTRYA